ncbi:prepilin-type N-terminal cleavage/methylation domain-containing protein [bacterium]|nr:prepilin-type N-terminal cleavage/methylation domain-containing protein [bacterium]
MDKQLTKSARGGFTLIELLIVVAIIAILAAIAVPNFLEAQVRSKVARSENDLRTIATALEAYRVDNNYYPVTFLFSALPARLARLTSPIAYLSTQPQDPFFRKTQTGLGGYDPQYIYASGNIYYGSVALYESSTYTATIYSLGGRGPDADINVSGYCMAHPNAFVSKVNVLGRYDPTNGTVSAGDILRLSSGTLGR